MNDDTPAHVELIKTPEHVELIEQLTDIEFEPFAKRDDVDPVRSMENTLLMLGRMAIARRTEGSDATANKIEDLIAGFGPVYTEIQDFIDEEEHPDEDERPAAPMIEGTTE